MKASETFLFAETWQFIWAWGLHSEPDILVIFFKIKKATDKPGSVLDSTEIQLLNRTSHIVVGSKMWSLESFKVCLIFARAPCIVQMHEDIFYYFDFWHN